MPGYWETIRKKWEADRTERYDDAEIRILKSRERRMVAQSDLAETAIRLQGRVQAAMYRAEAEVLEAKARVLDAQARILIKQLEVQQLMNGEVPAQLPAARLALPPAKQSIERHRDDQEIEELAQRIAHKIAKKPCEKRDMAWKKVQTGLRQDLEPFAAREVECRAEELLQILGIQFAQIVPEGRFNKLFVSPPPK